MNDIVGNNDPFAADDAITTDAGTPVTIPVLANDSDPDGDIFGVTYVSVPENGTVTVNDDNTVTYTPTGDFTGTDTFVYEIDDGRGGLATATVTVTVGDDASENSAPEAANDRTAIDENTSVTYDVLANDTDPDGDPLTVTGIEGPDHGTAAVEDDGSITYTPDEDFVGRDWVTYTVDDGRGGTDTATFDITVEEAGSGDDTTGGGDDTTGGGDGEDTTGGGDGEDTTGGGDGDDTTGNGEDTTGDGDDTTDGGDGDDTVPGDGGNTPPEANDDEATTTSGTPITVNVLANDTDADGNILGVSFISTPENGTIFQEDPLAPITYTPNAGFVGTETITYEVDDGQAGENTTDTATLTITVTEGDDTGSGTGGGEGGERDGIVEGTDGADMIDVGYAGDPDTPPDRIDNEDALIEGDAPNDDRVVAGAGDDTVDGNLGDDTIEGGDGADSIIGGDGADVIDGGAGPDTIEAGADADRIIIGSAEEGIGDVVQGNSEGDDNDTLDLSAVGIDGFRLTNVTPDDDGPDRESNGIDGTVEFLDGDGNVTGAMDFFNIEEVIPCFTPGTLIATPQGERLVEDLCEGDKIITRDNGIQEIRWIGRKDLTPFELARKPHMKPILIQKGALGNGLPAHDLLVSPNHRVLVNNDKTALYFEEREVLAAAKHLTGLDGVDEVTSLGVSYIHFMFDAHEVVLSNGAWTESFQPGDYSLKGIGNAQREEILELFPDLEHAQGIRAYASARRSLKRHEAELITK